MSSLPGTWQLIRAEFGGEAAPEVVTAKTTLVLTAATYQVLFDGRPADRGTYERGTPAETNTLTLRGLEGPNAGRAIPCIYQLVRDRLRICYGLDGTRPAAFSAAAGEQHYLATYRRELRP